MVRTIAEIIISAFAVLGIYFSITAILRRWAVGTCGRIDIRSAGERIPGKLILHTDGSALDIELRVCRSLVDSGIFSGVMIDGGKNTEKIIREIDRLRIKCGSVEYADYAG